MPLRILTPWRGCLALLFVAGILIAPAVPPGGDVRAAAPPPEVTCGEPAPQIAGGPVRRGHVSPPPITARNAVVIDGETGRVLLDGNAHQRVAPASTTKIMTALLAIEAIPLDTWTRSAIDARDMPGSSVMGLRDGQYIRMEDLVYGLMLPSGNDAAIEIARHTWGTEERFVEQMNERVAALGLTNTQFMNPHGLDQRGHYASAFDLAMIGRHAMANETFRRVANSRAHRLGWPADYTVYNGNSFLDRYPGAEGVKIGWTGRARWTLVTSATRGGHTLYVAVLGSEDRDGDAAALLDWTFAAHEWRPAPDEREAHAARLLRLFEGSNPLAIAFGRCR
jgi:D-alanyl-D-alanine carboxypeptidase